MFRGLNPVAVDDKGRFAIPARYREVILDEADGQLIVTIDTEERCLLLYAFPQWEEIEEKLQALPSFQPATRRIQRLLIGHATEVEMDRTGRILLPAVLREYAGIDRSVMFVGQSNKFEIWSDAQWELARQQWLTQGLADAAGEVPAELRSISL